MHAVVNRLSLSTPIPPDVWSRAETEVVASAQQIPGFRALYVIEVSADEVVLLIIGDSAETLDRVATEAGNAWMRENVIPHLAAPPDRRIGKVVASSEA